MRLTPIVKHTGSARVRRGRMTGLEVERVDAVDKPATGHTWLIVKSERAAKPQPRFTTRKTAPSPSRQRRLEQDLRRSKRRASFGDQLPESEAPAPLNAQPKRKAGADDWKQAAFDSAESTLGERAAANLIGRRPARKARQDVRRADGRVSYGSVLDQ